jgi:predicted amidohydrolase
MDARVKPVHDGGGGVRVDADGPRADIGFAVNLVDTMKVSLIQMNSISDKAANIAAAKRLIEKAIDEDAPDWVLLPEQFDWAGGSRALKIANTEAVPGGPAYAMAQELAATHGVFIHAGSIMEKIPGEDRIHNTTIVFNRQGEEIARYRKIHLFDVTTPDGALYAESATVKAGDAVVTYDCEGVTVGCSICYDLRFPDLFQALAAKGAQMIALPAAFTLQTGKDHWEILLRARAIETQTYLCASAQTGSFNVGNETRATYGHSLVADPWGHVVAKASDGEGVVSTRIDPALVEKVRRMIPVARHKVALAG